jgi:hypothetical protein
MRSGAAFVLAGVRDFKPRSLPGQLLCIIKKLPDFRKLRFRQRNFAVFPNAPARENGIV